MHAALYQLCTPGTDTRSLLMYRADTCHKDTMHPLELTQEWAFLEDLVSAQVTSILEPRLGEDALCNNVMFSEQLQSKNSSWTIHTWSRVYGEISPAYHNQKHSVGHSYHKRSYLHVIYGHVLHKHQREIPKFSIKQAWTNKDVGVFASGHP